MGGTFNASLGLWCESTDQLQVTAATNEWLNYTLTAGAGTATSKIWLPDHYIIDVYGETSYVKDEDGWVNVTTTHSSAVNVAISIDDRPYIVSGSISDMDTTDNIYAMRKYYSFVVTARDRDGATDIDKVYLKALNGTSTVFEVRATDLTGANAYAIYSNSTIIDLDTGSCTFAEGGNDGIATFLIRTEWDMPDYTNLELEAYVEDSTGDNNGWENIQTNYFDTVSRLTTNNFQANATYITQGVPSELTGTVYYADDPLSNTSSAFYPPNAQFTAVHIYNSTEFSMGSDTSIVNGQFSVIFTVADASKANTYHVYLDLIDDYTDGNAPDGDTVTISASPTVSTVEFVDPDDTDNAYAMRKYYTFTATINDVDGAASMAEIYFRIAQGGTVEAEVSGKSLNATPVFAIETNSTIIDLDTSLCTWAEQGNSSTATFAIRFEGDFPQDENLDIIVRAVDENGGSSGYVTAQSDYFDVITRIVSENFKANNTYISSGDSVKLTGDLRYATTTTGNTASSLHPPDSNITKIHIYNSSDVSQASTAVVTNGAFSIEFAVPSIVSANVYNIYVDFAGDFIDTELPDGDTVTVYAISAPLQYSFDGSTSTTTVTDFGGSNDGTISGAVRTGSGYYGRGMQFDGTDDYILVPDAPNLNITTGITVLAYVKTSDTGIQQILIKENAYSLRLTQNGVIKVTINTTDVDSPLNTFSADGTWHSVGFTYNQSVLKIYYDKAVVKTETMTGVIHTTNNDLYIGRSALGYFNGTLDEIKVLDYVPLDSILLGIIDATLVSYPYNAETTITTMEASNWVFAEESYDFTSIVVRQNASFPIDTYSMRFNDGVYYSTSTRDYNGSDWSHSSVITNEITNEETITGNQHVAVWELYMSDTISDAANVDLQMYVNDTSGNVDGWETVAVDYFNIYNDGGITESKTHGDGILVAGEGVFGIAAQNSTLNSWVRVNTTWRKWQHVGMLVSWRQSTAWDGASNYWDCPSEHNNTGYAEYGVDYYHDDGWVEGWKVHMEIADGKAGNLGGSADEAWVLINATWYNGGQLITYDTFYAYYEAIDSTDETTQFALYVDLWIGLEGSSSTVSGRVNPQYFGMVQGGWGPFASWKPKTGLNDLAFFSDNLVDKDGNVIGASEIDLFHVWAAINKTAAGGGSPSCDEHQWGLINYELLDWQYLSPSQQMIGITTPILTPTTVPGDVSSGFLSSLIVAMIEGITKPIVNALLSTAQSSFFVVASIIDSAFNYFNYEGSFVADITALIEALIVFMASSISSMTTLTVQLITLVQAVVVFWVTWLTRMINLVIEIGTIVVQISRGTAEVATGLGNIWELISIDEWIDVLPVLILISWLNSVDDRWRQGQGWISTIWGDISIVLAISSFMLDTMSRVVNTVIDFVFRLMNAIRG